MQYDVSTPDEYLSTLDDDWRMEKLLVIRSWIISHHTPPDEFIQYKMLAYGNESSTVFHLNAQKNYVSLYIGNIKKVERGRELLEGFDIGKGCIRIKKSTNLDQSQLHEFIKKAIEEWHHGNDLSC